MEAKRFLIIYHDRDGGHRLLATDERRVSEDIDMSDCHGEGMDIFWLDNEGKLIPVHVGEMSRRGEGLVYAYSPLVAGNQIVGYVSHTDH